MFRTGSFVSTGPPTPPAEVVREAADLDGQIVLLRTLLLVILLLLAGLAVAHGMLDRDAVIFFLEGSR